MLLMVTLVAQTSQQPTEATFNTWDTNGDGYVTDTEFESGFGSQPFYDEVYDSNTDGMIDDAEWRTALDTYEYLGTDDYGVWDLDEDGFISKDEFNQGAYQRWDHNSDGQIDQNEFESNYPGWTPHH